jgi:hypothetical protein
MKHAARTSGPAGTSLSALSDAIRTNGAGK